VSKTGYRETVSANVALILRQERERKGLSMTRVAEMSGLSQGMISLVEHEERNPSLDTLLRICGAMEIDLSAVLIRAETAAKKRLV
jgi:transcriptional regulator with XRE-family HTH domain